MKANKRKTSESKTKRIDRESERTTEFAQKAILRSTKTLCHKQRKLERAREAKKQMPKRQQEERERESEREREQDF